MAEAKFQIFRAADAPGLMKAGCLDVKPCKAGVPAFAGMTS